MYHWGQLRSRALTKQISQITDLGELGSLVAAATAAAEPVKSVVGAGDRSSGHSSSTRAHWHINSINISALLLQLARLAPNRGASSLDHREAVDYMTEQLAALLLPHVQKGGMDARSLITVCYSLGTLQARDCRQLHQALEAALLPVMPECSSLGVGLAAWGFEQVGHAPSHEWWQALQSHAAALAVSGHLQAGDILRAAHALVASGSRAKLRVRGAEGSDSSHDRIPTTSSIIISSSTSSSSVSRATNSSINSTSTSNTEAAMLSLACTVAAAQYRHLHAQQVGSLFRSCAKAGPPPFKPPFKYCLLPLLRHFTQLADNGQASPQAVANVLSALPRLLPPMWEAQSTTSSNDPTGMAQLHQGQGHASQPDAWQRHACQPSDWAEFGAVLASCLTTACQQLPRYSPLDMTHLATGLSGLAQILLLRPAAIAAVAQRQSSSQQPVRQNAGHQAQGAPTSSRSAVGFGSWVQAMRPAAALSHGSAHDVLGSNSSNSNGSGDCGSSGDTSNGAGHNGSPSTDGGQGVNDGIFEESANPYSHTEFVAGMGGHVGTTKDSSSAPQCQHDELADAKAALAVLLVEHCSRCRALIPLFTPWQLQRLVSTYRRVGLEVPTEFTQVCLQAATI